MIRLCPRMNSPRRAIDLRGLGFLELRIPYAGRSYQ